MINFQEKQLEITNYIKDNYKNYLPEELPEPNAYLNTFVDLDKYKQNTILFYNFGSYNFTSLSNEQCQQEISLDIILVCRNSDEVTLKTKLLQYTSAFYNFFDASNQLEAVSDFGIIETVDYYEAGEGNPAIKVSKISITLTLTD